MYTYTVLRFLDDTRARPTLSANLQATSAQEALDKYAQDLWPNFRVKLHLSDNSVFLARRVGESLGHTTDVAVGRIEPISTPTHQVVSL